MNLDAHIESVQSQLETIGLAVGGPAEEAAPKLGLLLAPTLTLAFQQILSEAVDSLNEQLEDTATVRVQIEGKTVDLSATPTAPSSVDDTTETPPEDSEAFLDGPVTRFTLRVPEHIKATADAAARAQGISLNSWFLRAATQSLSHNGPRQSRSSIQGWLG